MSVAASPPMHPPPRALTLVERLQANAWKSPNSELPGPPPAVLDTLFPFQASCCEMCGSICSPLSLSYRDTSTILYRVQQHCRKLVPSVLGQQNRSLALARSAQRGVLDVTDSITMIDILNGPVQKALAGCAETATRAAAIANQAKRERSEQERRREVRRIAQMNASGSLPTTPVRGGNGENSNPMISSSAAATLQPSFRSSSASTIPASATATAAPSMSDRPSAAATAAAAAVNFAAVTSPLRRSMHHSQRSSISSSSSLGSSSSSSSAAATSAAIATSAASSGSATVPASASSSALVVAAPPLSHRRNTSFSATTASAAAVAGPSSASATFSTTGVHRSSSLAIPSRSGSNNNGIGAIANSLHEDSSEAHMLRRASHHGLLGLDGLVHSQEDSSPMMIEQLHSAFVP